MGLMAIRLRTGGVMGQNPEREGPWGSRRPTPFPGGSEYHAQPSGATVAELSPCVVGEGETLPPSTPPFSSS